MWLSGTSFSFFLSDIRLGVDCSRAIQSEARTIMFREIEMFAIGIRCVHNLEDGHVVCHTTVVHAFITMEYLLLPRE